MYRVDRYQLDISVDFNFFKFDCIIEDVDAKTFALTAIALIYIFMI
jgi:hypothetical protein